MEHVQMKKCEQVSVSVIDMGGLEPNQTDISLRGKLTECLAKEGAVVCRGARIEGTIGFEEFVARFDSDPKVAYKDEAATPRSRVGKEAYTSTEYDPARRIAFHNEFPQRSEWPLKIYFYCEKPAASGGATTLANNRMVTGLLSDVVKEKFRKRQIRYVRNIGKGVGLGIENVFPGKTKEQIEQYCAKNDIQWDWRQGEGIRLTYVRPAFEKHPLTGEELWFNHCLFCNPFSIEPPIRRRMRLLMAEEDFPFNTYYGDGEPIEEAVLKEIDGAYQTATVPFSWQQEDILLLDNMLMAHGREPYTGDRKIRALFTKPVLRARCGPSGLVHA
jgi:hypothetical protein